MTMRNVFYAVLCMLVLACQSSTQSQIQQQNVYYDQLETLAFSENMKKMQAKLGKITILDVRTPEEYSSSHLKDALNVDVNAANFEEEIKKLDRETPLFVYCKSGRRSQKACEILKEMGFKSITNLEGGIEAWKEQKMEVVYTP